MALQHLEPRGEPSHALDCHWYLHRVVGVSPGVDLLADTRRFSFGGHGGNIKVCREDLVFDCIAAELECLFDPLPYKVCFRSLGFAAGASQHRGFRSVGAGVHLLEVGVLVQGGARCGLCRVQLLHGRHRARRWRPGRGGCCRGGARPRCMLGPGLGARLAVELADGQQ